MTCFSEYTIARARKQHRCEGCGNLTEVGQPYVRWTGLTDGMFGTSAYHPECRAAEIALNELQDYRCGDDWTSLLYQREAEDDDWLRAEWPLVAERLGIALPDPRLGSGVVRGGRGR